MQQDGGRADVQFGGMHDDGFHCGPGRWDKPCASARWES